MSDQSQLDLLTARLRDHLRATDRATLRQRLIADGVDPALIDQAFARIDADAARPTQPMSQLDASESMTHDAVSQPDAADSTTHDAVSQPDAADPTTHDAVSQPAVPTGSAHDPAYVARLKAYLEQHRNTYAREALQGKLLADGHDPQAVSLALAQVYGYQIAPGTPPLPATRGSTTPFILTLLGTFLFNYTVVPGLAIAASGIDQNGLVSFAIPVVALIGEIVAAVVLRGRNRPVARGLTWGIAASLLPIAGFALLFGICLALLGGF